MADHLIPGNATDAKGYLPGQLEIRLDEEHLALAALHAPPEELNALLSFGQKKSDNAGLLLRLWHSTLWCVGKPPKNDFTTVDISHAQTHLRLRGVGALHFLAQYASADLQATETRRAAVLRTSIGHYDCVIWWDSTRDVHLMVDRSYAQSFCDHLRALALRNDPPAIFTPQPTAAADGQNLEN